MLVKKWVLISMALAVGAGFLLTNLIQLSSQNDSQHRRISALTSQVERLQARLDEKKAALSKLDILSYHEKVVRKKYPIFSKIVDVAYEKSKEYGFNPNLILSLIQVESNFQPRAVSHAGAYGLMQVNLPVWKDELDIDPLRIFDIEYNIDLGLRILKHYHDESNGDLLQALHLYNNGYLYNNHKYKDRVVSSVFY